MLSRNVERDLGAFPKFAAWSDANGNMLTVHIYNP